MSQNDESIIRVGESPEEIAAEDAAFQEAFAAGRADEPPETIAADPVEPEPAATDGEKVAPVEPVVEGDHVAPAVVADEPAGDTPRLIAGLTEEQVGAALARAGTLQGTVDKMAGRIGQLMQQLDAIRSSPPTTQQAQKALDIKLEKLTVAFPELAAILKEDLAGLSGGVSAPVAEAPPPGLTQGQLDAILSERLNASANQTKEMIESRVLTVIHPDWNTVIREPQFALFRDSVLPAGEGRMLMESEDAGFIAGKLTEYKAWKVSQVKAPVVPATPAPASKRLTNAVLPATTRATASGPVTEEDAFAAGFASERAKRGG